MVQYHYVWIKNFHAFINDINKYDHKMYFCMKCMTHFTSEDKLKQHTHDYPDCHNNTPAKTEYPPRTRLLWSSKNTKINSNVRL